MILPDHVLRFWGERERLVSPFKPDNVQPASIDLTLDQIFLVPRKGSDIDLGDVAATVKTDDYTRVVAPVGYTMRSQEFLLGSTAETIRVPNDLVGIVEGKSSLGRLGLMVHSTAGYCDPGFEGKVTLEFYNLGPRAIMLRPGLRICQISFTQLSLPAAQPYGSKGLGSKYQGQSTTTASRYKG